MGLELRLGLVRLVEPAQQGGPGDRLALGIRLGLGLELGYRVRVWVRASYHTLTRRQAAQ